MPLIRGITTLLLYVEVSSRCPPRRRGLYSFFHRNRKSSSSSMSSLNRSCSSEESNFGSSTSDAQGSHRYHRLSSSRQTTYGAKLASAAELPTPSLHAAQTVSGKCSSSSPLTNADAASASVSIVCSSMWRIRVSLPRFENGDLRYPLVAVRLPLLTWCRPDALAVSAKLHAPGAGRSPSSHPLISAKLYPAAEGTRRSGVRCGSSGGPTVQTIRSSVVPV